MNYKKNFRAILILFLLFAITYQKAFSQTYAIPEKVKRIVFLGNSITYNGEYISDIEAWFLLHYPDRQLEFLNLGLPSETVSGLSEPGHADGVFPRPDLHERLSRVLEKTKPDLVLACYGMNDGIYLPFDNNRFQKFQQGTYWLHEEITKAGIPIIHITPPVFDEKKGKAYSNVLDIYSDWLISERYTHQWDVIDIHTPMKNYLQAQRSKDPEFILAEDGIHPEALGHFIIAKNILIGLAESEVEGSGNIHEALSGYRNADTIFTLIQQRQKIMKDAWLSETGHKRPWMERGLPMEQALTKYQDIEKEIRAIPKEKLDGITSGPVDWMDLRFQLFKVLPNQKDEIIMLGNSLTHNFEWHEIFPKANVKNRGISADATRGVLKRLPEILESKPKKIFIEIGINDLLWGSPVDTIFRNYVDIIQDIRSKSPKTKIYIQSLFPCARSIAHSNQTATGSICLLNSRLSKYCLENGLTYIDLYPKFELEKGLNPKYDCGDKLHLSPEGYVLWCNTIRNYIYE